ncbi:MAG: glycosyltransferase family 2 protein [Brevinema sp.]
MDQFLSLVIPCYNEEKVIIHTLDVLSQKMKEYHLFNYEIIVVDDGSRDSSLILLQDYAQKDSHIKVVSFATNRGQQMAFYAGMCYTSGDAVVLLDADLQDPPECIPEMIRFWKEGYHVVYGRRAKREGESLFKRLTAHMFYRILNYISHTDMPQDVGEFRLMDRAVVDAIIQMEERTRFNRALVSWLGFTQTELVFERPERFAGETKFGWREMVNLAKDAIFSFSYFPVLLIQFLGLSSIMVAIFILFYVLVSKILGLAVSGWASLMIVIVFFSGAILFSLGIIGEYIARIHTEVLKRPMFIPEKTYNLKDKKLPKHVARYISTHNKNLT